MTKSLLWSVAMSCTIHWLNSPPNIRKEHFQKVKNANILQDPLYGLATAQMGSSKPKWAIFEIEGHEAGFFQILETGICANMLHAVMLDRGPVWFDGYGSHEHFAAFLTAFRKEFPHRLGRAVRLMPEIESSQDVDSLLQQHKFRKKTKKYQTISLDLTQDAAQLRGDFKKNWRSALQKAENAGVTADWDTKGTHLDWFLKFYSFDKKTKGYDGPSVELIRALSSKFTPEGDMIIGRAKHEGQVIAAILLFCHGPTATYQIGWNTQRGRDLSAHNLLLWEALLFLKQRGLSGLDLGGVNESAAKNVKKFKEGMGGQLITLAGLYT